MINFIDKYIGFYFDGGFDQMIAEAQLDHKEIQDWASIAMLYKIGTEFISIDKTEEDDVFSLIENLFITCGVEIEMEGSLANLDLSDIGCGFEFDINKYNTVLSKALDAIHKHGLSLYELINE